MCIYLESTEHLLNSRRDGIITTSEQLTIKHLISCSLPVYCSCRGLASKQMDVFGQVDDQYGVAEIGLVPSSDNSTSDEVSIPKNRIHLTEDQYTRLQHVNPLAESSNYGSELYICSLWSLCRQQ